MVRQLWDSDLAWSFRRSPVTIVAAALTLICVGAALLAPWISPQDPFNMAGLNLNEAFTPPAWDEKGLGQYPLGTDNQGRDILSTIMHGARISLGVGLAAVVFSLVLGVSPGLTAGYVGVPATRPSLGTLIRIGNEFLYSGEWWITVFPGLALVVLVLSVNLLGDWLRDALNPKLR